MPDFLRANAQFLAAQDLSTETPDRTGQLRTIMDPYSQFNFHFGRDFGVGTQTRADDPEDFKFMAAYQQFVGATVKDTDGITGKFWTDGFKRQNGDILHGLHVGAVSDVHDIDDIVDFAFLEGSNNPSVDFKFGVGHQAPLRARSVPSASGFELIQPDDPHDPSDFPATAPPNPVIIGIIDDGINIAHHRFQGAGGASRVDFAWIMDGTATPKSANRHTVIFGREWTGSQIAATIAGNNGYEPDILRDMELLDFRHSGSAPLGLGTSHGTHVLDLAAGFEPTDPQAANHRIISVQLPRLVTLETSGALLSLFATAGIEYILDRARALSRHWGVNIPVVINFSYGISGGPHNGHHPIEQAMSSLKGHHQRTAPFGPAQVEFVLPAGNRYLARAHASVEAADAGPTTLTCAWRIQPADRTPNYLEIWLPDAGGPTSDAAFVAALTDFTITPPDGNPVTIDAAALVTSPQAVVYAADPGNLLLWASTDTRDSDAAVLGVGAGKRRILLATMPTEITQGMATPAPHGLWTVSLSANLPAGTRIEAWIQRDEPPVPVPGRGRASWFEDASILPDRIAADIQAEFTLAKRTDETVTRRGTLSGIATNPGTIVVGGYRHRSGKMSLYSGAASDVMRQPDFATVADTSNVLPGILAAGTRSGSVSALNGTSVAAPQMTRRLASGFVSGTIMDPALANPVSVGTAEDPFAAILRASNRCLPPLPEHLMGIARD